MLTLITGRIASGKTQMLIDAIGQRIKEKKKSVLIVPDHVTYHFERRLCHQLNIRGFIDVEVCSFNRLASNVIDYCGHFDKRFLEDTGRAMIVRACVAEVRDELTIFHDVSSRKGFSEKCLQMISTLENCGYSAEDLRRVAGQLPESVLKAKLTDMAAIFARYSAFLEGGYTDNADRLKNAEARLDGYRPLKEQAVFIDGFDVFTSRLYGFIGALMTRADMTVAISDACGGEDKNAYEIHRQTLEKLVSLAKDNGVPYRILKADYEDEATVPEIRFVRKQFYAKNHAVFPAACTHVCLEQYPDVTSEVTSAAKRIVQGVRAGRRYRDYSVLCNDLNRYTPVLTAVFKRYGIPVFTDAKHDVIAHPVAMYLFSLLKCVLTDFSPDAVGDYLLSGLTPLEKDEIDRFRSLIAEADIKNYELEKGLARSAIPEDEQAAFDLTRESVMTPLLSFRADLLKAKTAREMSACCYAFLENQGVYERLDQLVAEYEAMECYDLSDVTSQLWNLSQKLLEDLASLWGDRSITVNDFYEALFEGFNASPVSTIPSVLDCVTFGDLKAGREQPTHTVFLLGVNDGVIPAVYNDERLVSPAEAALLMDYQMELAHSATTEDARMRYNVYAAVSLAQDTLVVSCPLYTDNGGALRASHLFGRFQKLFPGQAVTQYAACSPREDLAQPLTEAQALLALAKDRENTPEAKALSAYFEETGDVRYRMLRRANRETAIAPGLAAKLFSPNEATSISRLETFALCPFRHFIEYGLAPKPENPFEALSSDIGTVFHRVLAEFVNTMPEEMTREECFARAGELFDQALPDIHYGVMAATSRQRVYNRRLRTILGSCAWKVYHQLKDFEPLKQELSFGYGKEAPILIETEYGTLRLRGKIDRVDAVRQGRELYLRIVDYKSGSKAYNENERQSGQALQLMLYMEASLERFGSSHPAAACYMTVSEDADGSDDLTGVFAESFTKDEKAKAGTVILNEEKFMHMIRETHRVAEEKGSAMLSGHIEAEPAEQKDCMTCPFRAVCRKNEKAVTEDA